MPSLLHAVLDTLEGADRPLTLRELSAVLGVEPGAVAGMIDFWVRKGRMRIAAGPDAPACGAGCGVSAPGCATACPFVLHFPRAVRDRRWGEKKSVR